MESDAEFVGRQEATKRELGTLETDDWPRLFTLARRGAAATDRERHIRKIVENAINAALPPPPEKGE